MNSRRIGKCIIMALTLHSLSLYAFHSTAGAEQTREDVPTQLIVKFRSRATSTAVLGKVSRRSAALVEFNTVCDRYQIREFTPLVPESAMSDSTSFGRDVVIVDLPAGVDPQTAAADFQRLQTVEYSHPDWQAELYAFPNDSLYNEQWALNNSGQPYREVWRRSGTFNDTIVETRGAPDADIDASEVLSLSAGDRTSVVVAIIDTGVDRDHPELQGHIWINAREIPENDFDDDHNGYVDDFYGWDYCGSPTIIPPVADNDPTDEHGHGTHCAGIIAATAGNGRGIAGIVDSCRIMSLKFYPVMLSSFAARAVVYAADNGADVISMSFGYPWPVRILEDALAYARSKGVILCAGTGNSGSEARNYPAAYDDVIAVGATNSYDSVTYFSTFGGHIDLCAPGQSILSLRAQGTDMYGISPHNEPGVHIIDSLYYLASGTSMSCPHVAGVAAYLRTISPGLTPAATQEILEQSADDLVDPYGRGDSFPGWDIYSGYGRVNLQRAVAATPSSKARINSPLPNQMASGEFEIVGTAVGGDADTYTIEIGRGDQPTDWKVITQSSKAVLDGFLGSWNSSGSDGRYTLKLTVGDRDMAVVSFYVANSTLVHIESPAAGDTARSSVLIEGDALTPGFREYKVSLIALDDPGRSQAPIGSAAVPIVNGPLCAWNTGLLSDGWYEIHLEVFSEGGSVATDSQVVYVQSPFSCSLGWRTQVDGKISMLPNFGDFDRDGANEIIFGTSSELIALNLDGTKDSVWTDSILVPLMDNLRCNEAVGVTSPRDVSLSTSSLGDDTVFVSPDMRIPIAVGNLDGDRFDDFVGVCSVFLFGYSSQSSVFTIHLSEKPFIRGLETGDEAYYASVFLKDIDGDGRAEIHYYPAAPDKQSTRYIYRPDGTMIYGGPIPRDADDSFSAYIPADLDGDGIDELYAYGRYLCEMNLSVYVVRSFDMSGWFGSDFECTSLSAVDIDADGLPELIAYGYGGYGTSSFWVFAFDEHLRLKDGWPRDTGISSFLSPSAPVFGDIDLDGSIEYFITSYELTQGEVFAWHVDGAPYMGDSLFALFSVTPNPARLYSPILADVNGDGFPELVACAEPDVYASYRTERIVAWDRYGDIVTGWPIVTHPLANYTAGRHSPVVGDIDGDGNIDLIMTTADNNLVFLKFAGSPFDSTSSPVTFWRYNRSLNNSASCYLRPTSIATDEPYSLPREFQLMQNHPNPFNPCTVIEYSLQRRTEVRLSIFNVLGEKVRSYQLGAQPMGRNRLLWDGRDKSGIDVASGVYFYRIETATNTETKKMVKLK